MKTKEESAGQEAIKIMTVEFNGWDSDEDKLLPQNSDDTNYFRIAVCTSFVL